MDTLTFDVAPEEPAQTVCPCCGAEVSGLDLLIEESSGHIAFGGASTRLTPTEFDYLRVLLDGYPRVISRDGFLRSVYGLRNDVPDIKIVDVQICKLRKKVDGLGLIIATMWGVGYSLQLGPAAEAALIRRQSFQQTRNRKKVADHGDVATIAMLRGQGFPMTDIARRTNLTFSAVAAAVDAIEQADNVRALLAHPKPRVA